MTQQINVNDYITIIQQLGTSRLQNRSFDTSTFVPTMCFFNNNFNLAQPTPTSSEDEVLLYNIITLIKQDNPSNRDYNATFLNNYIMQNWGDLQMLDPVKVLIGRQKQPRNLKWELKPIDLYDLDEFTFSDYDEIIQNILYSRFKQNINLYRHYWDILTAKYDIVNNVSEHTEITRTPNLTNTQGGGTDTHATGTFKDTTTLKRAYVDNSDPTTTDIDEVNHGAHTLTDTIASRTNTETGNETTVTQRDGNIGTVSASDLLVTDNNMIQEVITEIVFNIMDDLMSQITLPIPCEGVYEL